MRTPAFRAARSRAAAAAAAGLCAALILPLAGTASAVPAPTGVQISSVGKTLADLTKRIGVEVEKYDSARIALAAAQRRAAAADVAAARARQVYLAKRATLSRFAATAYQSGNRGQIAAVVASSPDEYLDQLSTLDVVAKRGTEIVSATNVARMKYAGEVRTARAAADSALRVTRQLAASKAAIEGQIATQRRILAGLQAEQARLQRLAAAQAAARNAAAARTAAAAQQISSVTRGMTGGSSATASSAPSSSHSATSSTRSAKATTARSTASGSASSTSSTSRSTVRAPVAASGRGATAVAAAESVLGRPYVWAAAGPSSFDCSGLTMWAWAHAGVSLPHSSSAQYSSGTHVSKSALAPGDLLFFYSPISHVGMYIGGGQMIHAPHTGDVVRIATPMWSDFAGAVRPG